MDFKTFLKKAGKVASVVAHHAGAHKVPLLHKLNRHVYKKLSEEITDFEAFLLEQNLAVSASKHFAKATSHPEQTLHWHKHNARGHAVLSQHYDKIGNQTMAKDHHSKSEHHISCAEKIEDQKAGH